MIKTRRPLSRVKYEEAGRSSAAAGAVPPRTHSRANAKPAGAPRPGGRCALHWGQGYHVEGRFLEVDPPRRAAIAWQGTGEPGETRVAVELEEREGRVSVRVVHSGFGPGSEWDAAVAQSERGWETGLENLQSTLETGIDLRLARQPFLGINLDLLTPERLPPRANPGHSWNMFTVLLPLGETALTRKQVVDALQREGIGTGLSYEAIHLTSHYRSRGWREGQFPVSERIGRETLTLPLHPEMAEGDVERVCATLRRVLRSRPS